jgi:hypothetical protein
MAKLTKKQREALHTILWNAQRASAYVHREDVALCHIREIGADMNGVPYPTSHSGWQSAMTPGREMIGPMIKSCGSDLCGLPDVVRQLSKFLEAN